VFIVRTLQRTVCLQQKERLAYAVKHGCKNAATLIAAVVTKLCIAVPCAVVPEYGTGCVSLLANRI
jgi:hypothetical protein